MRKNEIQSPNRRLISVAETAAYLGVTTKTCRRWIASGQLTAYRVGPRLLKIDANELEATFRPIPTAGGGR